MNYDEKAKNVFCGDADCSEPFCLDVRQKIAAALRSAAADAYEDAATMSCCVECDEGADDMRAKEIGRAHV